MSDNPPKIININHDHYHAEYVGLAQDGHQFFLTTPFVPAIGGHEGREFIALYLFDAMGQLVEARIDDLGPRSSLDEAVARNRHRDRIESLGEVEFGRIKVQPFSLERFDTEFGLVLRPPEDEGDPWAVEAQPGNYMAFFEPWGSGEYDT